MYRGGIRTKRLRNRSSPVRIQLKENIWDSNKSPERQILSSEEISCTGWVMATRDEVSNLISADLPKDWCEFLRMAWVFRGISLGLRHPSLR